MATEPSVLEALSSQLTTLAARSSRLVVGVAGRSRRPASGVAIGGDLVITADHVLDEHGRVSVLVDEQKHDAVVVGRDAAADLALLRVDGFSAPAPATAPPPGPGALVLSLARTSSGTLSTGLGVITSVGGPLRTGRGIALPQIIRTDAALRPGTAGGALVDASGALIGMTTPGLLRGLPVAIPAAHALDIAQRLVEKRPLKRGYLGVSVQAVTLADRQRSAAARDTGLLVFAVAEQGAAERAGLLVGDIIVRFNEQEVASADDLQDALADLEPGTSASLAIVRGEAAQTLAVTTGERPQR